MTNGDQHSQRGDILRENENSTIERVHENSRRARVTPTMNTNADGTNSSENIRVIQENHVERKVETGTSRPHRSFNERIN